MHMSEPQIFTSDEPAGGFPGDQESGGWAGEAGDRLFTAGGVIASRGVGELDPIHGQPSRVDSITEWPPPDLGPRYYELDVSGQRTGPAAPPGT
jgi:hypothetical protein